MKHLRIAKVLEDRLKIAELEKCIARKVHEYTKKKPVCVADWDDHGLKLAEFYKKKIHSDQKSLHDRLGLQLWNKSRKSGLKG